MTYTGSCFSQTADMVWNVYKVTWQAFKKSQIQYNVPTEKVCAGNGNLARTFRNNRPKNCYRVDWNKQTLQSYSFYTLRIKNEPSQIMTHI